MIVLSLIKGFPIKEGVTANYIRNLIDINDKLFIFVNFTIYLYGIVATMLVWCSVLGDFPEIGIPLYLFLWITHTIFIAARTNISSMFKRVLELLPKTIYTPIYYR